MSDVATITRMQRRFRFGATVLEDIDPSLAPSEVLALYVPSYGFLAQATLGEPTNEGDYLVYPVLKPAVHTKGASRPSRAQRAAADKAIEGIRHWAGTNEDVSTSDRWKAVFELTRHAATSAPAAVDSAYLPMV
ncbi:MULTISPECIES: PRTRC system protein C [unclassified Rhodanobacter]|uniref:PRTRC system protein C n=1 Tax=unclassified Rhodanobacter TaxID=2621553 RepID=UPI0007AA0FD4|nr:PRTRC system protein C [Rhodanobacter sp. FW510-R10]KZC32588.1 hypothetical protein RhoFW510R10_11780 [Rhodanobacter sp. FW510-R10]